MAPPLNAKKWVEEKRASLDRIVGHRVRVKVNNMLVATDTTLQAMIPAKIGDIDNPPEKRQGADGKQYTPPMFALVFDQGQLVFVIEDTEITILLREGVRLIAGNTHVEIVAVDANN